MKILDVCHDFLVTAYARQTYAHIVRKAEKIYADSNRRSRVAVVSNPYDNRKVCYVNRKGLRKFNNDYYHSSRGLSFSEVLKGAWYYTAGPAANGRTSPGMSAKDMEARKRVFIRTVLSLESRKVKKIMREKAKEARRAAKARAAKKQQQTPYVKMAE